MNIQNIINNQGNIKWNLIFIEYFDKIPNYYEIQLKNKIDINELVESISKYFPKAEYYTEWYANEDKTSAQSELEEEDLKLKGESRIFIIDKTLQEVWMISEYNISLYSNHKNNERIESIKSKLPIAKPEENEGSVRLVASDNGYYYTIKSSIKPTNINISENYNDDFLKVNEDLLKFLNDKETGVALLYGEKGSGKTNFVRNLVTTTNKKYLVITNAVAAHIAEPEFISFLLSQKDSVFILEDCEQILMERESNLFGGAIANILNMSDGLLSDIFNIKFICTFNTSIDRIDKALLRKGRCKINYEFKALKSDKVAKLNEKYKLGIRTIKDMTLAEIYNYSEEKEEKKTRKIGF